MTKHVTDPGFLGGEAILVEEPGLPWILRLPKAWIVDSSGAADGAIVARDAEPRSLGFYPTVTLTATPIPTGFTRTGIQELLEDQRRADQFFEQELVDYRLIDLSVQQLGTNAEPAIYRLAMYVTAEDVPVSMAQFVTRDNGYETTLTVTWATADSHWIGNSQAIATGLEWRMAA